MFENSDLKPIQLPSWTQMLSSSCQSFPKSLTLSFTVTEGRAKNPRNALHLGIYARKRSPARSSHLTGGKHSRLSSGSAAMTARLLFIADDDLMARTALWGRSDCLAAMLDGNQEAPPSDTNAGSAHRITPHSPSCGTSVSVPGEDALLAVTHPSAQPVLPCPFLEKTFSCAASLAVCFRASVFLL